MTQVGFGVVGLGAIARVHIGAIEKAPKARLVAVASRDADKAAALGSECDCAAYASYEAIAADDRVDVIVVCTASGAHLEPALAAARAKKHVLVEKPLEVSVARCDEMIGACDQEGVLLGGIFQSRFYDGNQLVHQAIQEGRFGRLTHAAAYVNWWRTQAYYDQAAWRGTWRYDGGGAVMNQAIHDVDLLQWLMGDVDSVFAFADCLAHTGLEVEDTAVAVLRFGNGALGVIEAMTSAYPGYPKRLEVHGDGGGAVLIDSRVVSWSGRDIGAQEEQGVLARYAEQELGGGSADPMAISHVGHERQIADMAQAVLDGRDPVITGREASKAVAIAEALYESSRLGRPVNVGKR